MSEPNNITVGCAGCRHHARAEDRTGFFCSYNMPGYPNETNDTCGMWRKPTRGRIEGDTNAGISGKTTR